MCFVIGLAGATALTDRGDSKGEVGSKATWLDLYASHDPVSNGPVVGMQTAIPITSHEVTNLASTLRDHTTYHRNDEEVVARLTKVCANACGRT